MKLNSNMDFILFERGEPFLLNGASQRGLFIEATDKISFYDDIILTTNFPFDAGGLVSYQNSNWLMISEVQNNNDQDANIYRVRIRKCNNNALTLNISGILHTVPCIVMDKVALNIDSSTYISSLDTQIYILVQNNALNSNIGINNIFHLGNLNYRVLSIDDISKPGLLSIKLEFSAEAQVFPNYSIEITNGETGSTDPSTPIQLNIQQKDGEIVLNEPLPMIFLSSDNSIATVDSSTGLITPISVGTVTITVSLESNLEVNDSIIVTIEEAEIADNKTATISGEVEIIKAYTENYTCSFQNNGVPYSDTSIYYLTADDGVSSTTLATIVSQDAVANTCTVKGNNLGYVKLFCKNSDNSVVSPGYRIKIASLF